MSRAYCSTKNITTFCQGTQILTLPVLSASTPSASLADASFEPNTGHSHPITVAIVTKESVLLGSLASGFNVYPDWCMSRVLSSCLAVGTTLNL